MRGAVLRQGVCDVADAVAITWEALEEAMKANMAAKNFRMGGYGLSKAGLTALTMIQVKLHVQVLRLQ